VSTVESECLGKQQLAYTEAVPKLWNDTIDAHRRAVRESILDASWELLTERGFASITMAEIAERSGIGRATLYKYFPDVEAILFAWHERHVAEHLRQLAAIGEQPGEISERLEAVLDGYALIVHNRGHHGPEVVALLHRGEQVTRAEQQLVTFLRALLAEGAKAGMVRDDVAPEELARYCLHALSAAAGLSSRAAVRRLVKVTLAGLRGRR